MKFSYRTRKIYYHLFLSFFWIIVFVFYRLTAPEKLWVSYVSIFMILFYLAHFLYQKVNHYVQIHENLLIVYVFPKRIISLCDLIDISITGDHYSLSTNEQIVAINRAMIHPKDHQKFDIFIKNLRDNLVNT